jgi:hypothetical protein
MYGSFGVGTIPAAVMAAVVFAHGRALVDGADMLVIGRACSPIARFA